MAKFIGQTGLIYLWGKIKTYVANYVKIVSSTGKDTITAGNNSIDVYDWAQASTKPSYDLDEVSDGTTNKAFTSTEKNKLNGIASGAEVNQNAFSNVKVGSTTIAADGKTDTLEIAGGGDVTVTPDATNDKVIISVTTPKNTSDLTNDSGFITISDVPEGAAASTTTPKMDGTAAVGSETKWAKGDHVHPSDTSKLNVSDTITEAQINALFASEIAFTISGTTYHAEAGMTWAEWVNSEYNVVENPYTGADSTNNGKWYIYMDSIYRDTSSEYSRGIYGVTKDDVITENYSYSAPESMRPGADAD